MTSRVATNLAWEVLARGRGTLFALAAALTVACVIATWRGAPAPGRADGVADALVFAMVLSMLFVFGVFNHTHLDRRSGQTGFPNRLFTYPVSTRMLVGVPMLCAVGTTALLYLAWIALVLHPLGRNLPVVWPALVLAAAMAWYQAALWSLAAFRVARMVALCVIGTALVTLAILPTLEAGRGGAWADGAPARAAMAAIILAAYACALLAVNRQRHAGGHGAGLRVIVERVADALPSRAAPFRSPFHAQCWLECRRGALLLPAAMLLVMLLVLLSAAMLGRVDARLTQFTLSVIIASPFALAALTGSVASVPILTAADGSLAPFLSTRPIDCGDMVAAKLAAAAVATILAWIVVLALVPVWLVVWCDTAPVAATWDYLSRAFPGRQRWIMLALCFAVAWLLTWRMSVVNLYVAITGRPVALTVYVMITIAVAVTTVSVVLSELDTAMQIGAPGTIFGSVVVLAWLLNLALVVKLAIAVASTAKGLARGWVTARSVVIYGGFWTVAAVVVAGTLYLLASHEPRVDGAMPWMKLLGALAGLSLVPLARVALSPRVLAESRHG